MWGKILSAFPMLLALGKVALQFYIARAKAKEREKNERLRDALKAEVVRRQEAERENELRRRADRPLDDRRRAAGWTGDGHDDAASREPDTRRG